MGSFLSNHPLCCPARAEIMSGQYAQNSGTWHNQGPWGGSQSFPYHDTGLASWLNTSGYRTAYVGKYLNEWEKDRFRPGGWTDFDAFTRKGYEPMGFSSYNNGHPVRHDNIYTADWVAERTSDLIGEYSASDAPFFIYAGTGPTTRYEPRRPMAASCPGGQARTPVRRRGLSRDPETVVQRGWQVQPRAKHQRGQLQPGAPQPHPVAAGRGRGDGIDHRRATRRRRAGEHIRRVHLRQRLSARRNTV